MAFDDSTNVTGAQTGAPIVVGLFTDAEDAHRAVTQLRERGFNTRQIGAAFRNRSAGGFRTREGAYEGGSGSTTSHAREGWWEKLKDMFTGDDAEDKTRDTVPDGAETLSRRGYTADENEYDYSGSEIEGSLAGTGIPTDRASYLTRNLQSGGAIVTVRAESRTDEAEEILSSHNAQVRYEDSIQGGTSSTGRTEGDQVNRTTGYREGQIAGENVSETDRIQLFGEILKVHKERVSRGEVRLHKEVVSENQTIEVPVTREELVLERVAVDKNAPATAGNIGDEREVRVPLTEERVRVEKTPVVTEEVKVGKRQITDTERVGDEVRHEELRVDDSRGSGNASVLPRGTDVDENVTGRRLDDTMTDRKREPGEDLDQPGNVRRSA